MVSSQSSRCLLAKQLILFIILSCLFVINGDSITDPLDTTLSKITLEEATTAPTTAPSTTTRSRDSTRSSEAIISNNDNDNLEQQQQDEKFLRRRSSDISTGNDNMIEHERDLEQCTGQNSCPNKGDDCWCFFTILMWNELPCNYQQALMRMNETEDSWDNCLVNEIWGFGWYDLDPDHRAAVRTLGFDEQRWYNTGYYSCDWTCNTGTPVIPGIEVNNCLSTEDELQVLDKGLTSVHEITEGDKVLVSDDEYQEIYSFGHKDAYAVSNFLQFTTSSGNQKKPLELSEEHLVLRQKSPDSAVVPTRADNIQVGDFLVGSHGGVGDMVTQISTVKRPGLYSPLTKDGTFFANGVLVSSYTAIQEQHAESFMLNNFEVASHQFMSHVAITPFRSMCLAGFNYVCEQRNDKGQLLFAAFAEKTNFWVSVFLLWNMIPLYILEQMFGSSVVYYLLPLAVALISRFLYASFTKKRKLVR